MISSKWSYILLLFSGSFFSYVSAKPPAIVESVGGIASNAVSALFKWLWSLKPTNKIGLAIPSRWMFKFESGYTVETVFEGSKLGIEPYAVEVTRSGELLVLDSQNSNIHKISTSFSRYNLPKLVAGSSEGYSGHVDGKPTEARMNHPKGLTMDDSGNIYVADTENMAIRKITDAGVVTIAVGKRAQDPGHISSPSDNMRFSNDFDLIYVSSSCSILVVDRGYQAIREIPLHDDDCSFMHYDGNLHLGIAVLGVAVFFGFMLALLQSRITEMFLSSLNPRSTIKGVRPTAYQVAIKSVRPPLIPPEDDEHNKEEEGFFDSLGHLFTNTGSAIFKIFESLSSSCKNKPPQHFKPWPIQESYVIPHEYAHTRDLNKRNTYKLTKDPENTCHFKPNQYIYGGLNRHFHQDHHQINSLAGPQTSYEENSKTTNEVVFGAIQEHDRMHGAMSIKAIEYSNPSYSIRNFRPRYNHMDYTYDMY